jgi:hypothetical protein
MLPSSRGHVVGPGLDVCGLSRHCMRRVLCTVAADALALRGDSIALWDREVAAIAFWAKDEYGRLRRLALPRTMLGAVLEQAAMLDRTAAQEGEWFGVESSRIWPDDVPMRNLAILQRGRHRGSPHR